MSMFYQRYGQRGAVMNLGKGGTVTPTLNEFVITIGVQESNYNHNYGVQYRNQSETYVLGKFSSLEWLLENGDTSYEKYIFIALSLNSTTYRVQFDSYPTRTKWDGWSKMNVFFKDERGESISFVLDYSDEVTGVYSLRESGGEWPITNWMAERLGQDIEVVISEYVPLLMKKRR